MNALIQRPEPTPLDVIEEWAHEVHSRLRELNRGLRYCEVPEPKRARAHFEAMACRRALRLTRLHVTPQEAEQALRRELSQPDVTPELWSALYELYKLLPGWRPVICAQKELAAPLPPETRSSDGKVRQRPRSRRAPNFVDLTGTIFDNGTEVLREVQTDTVPSLGPSWLCRCCCGTEVTKLADNIRRALRKGDQIRCGRSCAGTRAKL